MDIKFSDVLTQYRKSKKYTQQGLSDKLSKHGYDISKHTIYNWEKNRSQPSLEEFFAVCSVLGIDDLWWEIAGVHKGVLAGLNTEGRNKVREFADMVFRIDTYRDEPEQHVNAPNMFRLYSIPVSAGVGSYLDESDYEMIEAPRYVPQSADYALRISGDSMEPLYLDGQIIWIKEQSTMDDGEIGVFFYDDSAYCKKYVEDSNGIVLRPLNECYDDIEINEYLEFKIMGKVVA